MGSPTPSPTRYPTTTLSPTREPTPGPTLTDLNNDDSDYSAARSNEKVQDSGDDKVESKEQATDSYLVTVLGAVLALIGVVAIVLVMRMRYVSRRKKAEVEMTTNAPIKM